MKLLTAILCLAVLSYACQNHFTAAQKTSEKDAGKGQTLKIGNEQQAHSFTANNSNHIFINTEKPKPIVLTKKIFLSNNAPAAGSIDVEMKERTTAQEIVLNNSRKQSHNYALFPASDFLFGSLIIVN